MPCLCHDVDEEVRNYHLKRGFCDESQGNNYESGLAGMLGGSYGSVFGKGGNYQNERL